MFTREEINRFIYEYRKMAVVEAASEELIESWENEELWAGPALVALRLFNFEKSHDNQE